MADFRPPPFVTLQCNVQLFLGMRNRTDNNDTSDQPLISNFIFLIFEKYK